MEPPKKELAESGFLHFPSDGKPIKAWTKGVEFDFNSQRQVANIAAMPFIHKHVAVMPDVHLGRGATVGSVIPTKGAIIPAAVGVDIGCGMCAVRTSLTSDQLPDSLKEIRRMIEKVVPVGFADHGNAVPKTAEKLWYSEFKHRYDMLQELYPAVATRRSPAQQIGTLGGGNHFIELCLDQDDRLWVMLHSGSRGAGNRIGQFFIAEAKREMERLFIHLPDKDLAYISEGSAFFDMYVTALGWAQDYARTNREVMMARVLDILARMLTGFAATEEAVNCHHNYVERENHFGENVWVTRKGAVRARVGDLGIIPGSMGARSFIVRGLGNADSFQSCSHGAGRVMSRTEAKRQISVEDHRAATEGVECRKDEGVVDESPAAYKDIDAVMAAQADLVEIVHTLKQIVCVKG